MKKTISPMLVFILLGAVPNLLFGQSPAAEANAGKIGVVNGQEAIASTAEGKKAFADLQTKYQPRQQELQRMQQDIQAIQDQLQKQGATLSEDEQRRLSRELEDKQKLLKRSTEDANADFTADRDEVLRRIGQKMIRVIGDYAQQNGFQLVLDGAQVPVYYAAKNVELTEEIVKRYDAANPVAQAPAPSAAPATHPASGGSKPASTNPKPGDKPKP